MIVKGMHLVFGIQPMKPIEGLPPGKVRIRQRPRSAMKVYVRDDRSIRCFFCIDAGDVWKAAVETGRNVRLAS